MIAIVAKLTITSVFLGSTNAIAIIANPVTQFDVIKVFFRPQYFNIMIHTKVPAINIKIFKRCDLKKCLKFCKFNQIFLPGSSKQAEIATFLKIFPPVSPTY